MKVMIRTLICVVVSLLTTTTTLAFSTPTPKNNAVFDPLNLATATTTTKELISSSNMNTIAAATTLATTAFMAHPFSALAATVAAEADDEYEYGAVDAPIGIAWAAGSVLILTSLLPLALQGGEEAFEEMRERDSVSFGKKNSDVLKGRKKR